METLCAQHIYEDVEDRGGGEGNAVCVACVCGEDARTSAHRAIKGRKKDHTQEGQAARVLTETHWLSTCVRWCVCVCVYEREEEVSGRRVMR